MALLIKNISKKWPKNDKCLTWLVINLEKSILTCPFDFDHFDLVFPAWSFWVGHFD